MDKLSQKRQYLKSMNDKQLIMYKNRAYIQKDVMLLRDYIKQRIKTYTYNFNEVGYKVEQLKVDDISKMIFKPKNIDEIKQRQEQDIWEENNLHILLPNDTVIDKSSRFAYQYNFKSGISSKYFLLDTYGINSKKDIEDNSYGRVKYIRDVKTNIIVHHEKTYPKKKVIRYYYNGKQITKAVAFEPVQILKNNIEEVIYRYNRKLKRIYIDIKTDKKVLKKDAYKTVLRLRRGVKKVVSYVRGKTEIVTIKKRVSKEISKSVYKVNMFAQTYKNYLPYFLFCRLVKKVIPADKKKKIKEHTEETIKFYISSYLQNIGTMKMLPSLVKNHNDFNANSDMFGKILLDELLKNYLTKDLFVEDKRIRTNLEKATDSYYQDIPVEVLFFIGQKDYTKAKKYRVSIKDIDEQDKTRIKDTSSLEINGNKQYIVNQKRTDNAQKQIINLNDNEQYQNILNDIIDIKDRLDIYNLLEKLLKEKKISRITINNVNKLYTATQDKINDLNEQVQVARSEQSRTDIKDKIIKYKLFMNYFYNIDNATTIKEEQQYFKKFLKRFNKENKIKLEHQLQILENKKQEIEQKEKQTIQRTDKKQVMVNGQVNLLNWYHNEVIDAINKDNPITIK